MSDPGAIGVFVAREGSGFGARLTRRLIASSGSSTDARVSSALRASRSTAPGSSERRLRRTDGVVARGGAMARTAGEGSDGTRREARRAVRPSLRTERPWVGGSGAATGTRR